MAAPSVVAMRCRFAFASIGILVGVSVFFTFAFVYQNWDVAIFGLLSGVFAAVALYTHVEYTQTQWHQRSHWLTTLMYVGCFGQLAGVCAFVAYLCIAIIQHQPLTPYGPAGYYLACVWCAMTWKWAFLLFFYARGYRRLFEATTGLSGDYAYEKV